MGRLRKYLTIVVLITLTFACSTVDDLIDEIEEEFENLVIDPEVSEEDALAQNYNLTTPLFGIKVAINDDVDKGEANILEFLDEASSEFLDCQFFEGADAGFDNFELDTGEIVPPLSQLRVYVVPFTFECDAADKDICAGIYFGSSDIIVIAEKSLGRCSDLPLYKHELAHRYGLESSHSNMDEYEECSNPPDCDFDDFLDFDIFG